jgi:hypothetical protein
MMIWMRLILFALDDVSAEPVRAANPHTIDYLNESEHW